MSPHSRGIRSLVEPRGARVARPGDRAIKGPDYAENGVFAWVVDPDDNKLEIWEPKLWNDANKRSLEAGDAG